MATGPAISSALESISRQHLECSICQERYQQPKILECLHSFCEQCLLKYCNTKHEGSTAIPCPVYRQETKLPEVGVEGLRSNFHLIGMVDEFELQEKLVCVGDMKLLCETCDDGNQATHRCLDCAQNICTRCRLTQLRTAATTSHVIASLEDIREGKVKLTKKHLKQQPKCTKHEGEVTRFFCTTCEMLICRDCTVINHCKPDHSYVENDEATSRYKQSLAKLFYPLESTLIGLQKSREKVLEMKKDLGVTVKRVMTEVQDGAAEIRAEVTAQENRILDDIKNIQTDREQKLDECEKAIGLEAKRFQHSLDTAREVTETASYTNFLSLYPTISKDLKVLADHNIPRVDNRLAFLKFKQSEGASDVNLGQVVMESKWELCREFGSKGSGPGEFKFARDIAARHQPNEIAVADFSNKRVVICSIDGHQKSTIPMHTYPCAIAATRTNNRFVVGFHNSPAKVFNSDNTLAYEFSTMPLSEVRLDPSSVSSVAIKTDGAIAVGHTERMLLTEYSPTDGELLRTIPVQIKPYFLAVDIYDRFVISAQWQEVHIADGNGTTKRVIKPILNDQPAQNCNGVCTDSSGIYVAVCVGEGTGHIHHYDHQGGFLKCIAQGLHSPLGITFTPDGQLAVANYDSVKIYHQV